MDAPETTHTKTCQRLLEVASEVFAERGFHNATVREICQQANANIAAINYHFGDKERLYAAVLKYASEKHPVGPQPDHHATAEQRLREFIRSVLLLILDKGSTSCYGRLMAWEMVEPTRALDALVEESIRPSYEMLMSIVRDLLGRDTHEDQVRKCAASILGQCVFYNHASPLLARLYPEQKYDREEVERLTDHITRFSLSALNRLSDEKKGDLR